MEGERIKNLKKLLRPVFGENVEIVDKTITNLTLPGENYWSDMLNLQIKTRNKDTKTTNTEYFVAKCPVIDEKLPKGIADDICRVFKPEIAFYKEIIPTMQKFLSEHGLKEVEFFPKLIAARYDLDGNEEPDGDAVMILENLQAAGYSNADRHKGFDLDGAKLLLTDLAVFHAIPLAIKQKDPELFKKTFVDKSFMPKWVDNPTAKGPDGDHGPPQIPRTVLKQILTQDSFCSQHVNKLDGLMSIEEEGFKTGDSFRPKPNKSAFSGFVHKDLWLNNTMQLKNEDGEIIKNKFLDFQVYSVQEITADLIFFLMSSVEIEVLEEHFDDLLMMYHKHFIKTLEALNCDIAPFKYALFINNLKQTAPSEFFHIILMNILVIFGKKGQKANFEEVKNLTMDDIHPIARRKLVFLFKLLIEKEWYP
ncbi:uncharacterized protein LOC126888441 isoform X4 [Diabrotica virgifera virgifera]|uniref:CHK kinase-like domain-containing protein n=1 Tax=Diabrotica virgifera virgifera TaxID=50390 RepID=A0ABM5KR36_DIAVI|nr:uncharacterized protein LOC126888441 isoform X2 [Diabrotica virgifera virgifera]XP_050512658.1 uncharacterized protein LOC126888441 isoform X4 [Diabrotica virgifera virgifera]